jgi:hypothetical protein
MVASCMSNDAITLPENPALLKAMIGLLPVSWTRR